MTKKDLMSLSKYNFYIEYKQNNILLITKANQGKLIYGTGIRLKTLNPIKSEIEKNNLKMPNKYKLLRTNLKYKNQELYYWFVFYESIKKENRKPFIKELLNIAKKYKEEVVTSQPVKIKKTDIIETKFPDFIKSLKKYEDNIYASIQLRSEENYSISIIYSKDILAWRILIRNEKIEKRLKKNINLIKNNSKYILVPINKKECLENSRTIMNNILQAPIIK